jgi:hypothetical protein
MPKAFIAQEDCITESEVRALWPQLLWEALGWNVSEDNEESYKRMRQYPVQDVASLARIYPYDVHFCWWTSDAVSHERCSQIMKGLSYVSRVLKACAFMYYNSTPMGPSQHLGFN